MTNYPLISCIMPTADRRQYVGCAIRSFLAQTWPNKELIVVDNGVDPIHDLIPEVVDIRYFRQDPQQKMTTGALRNKACEYVRGKFVAHFDDDDCSHPMRLKEQWKHTMGCDLPVVGYRSILFADEAARTAWVFECGELYNYALGTSLFYRRDYWRCHSFADRLIGEDDLFVREAINDRKIQSVAGHHRIVARVHARNTSVKIPDEQWKSVSFEHAENLLCAFRSKNSFTPTTSITTT